MGAGSIYPLRARASPTNGARTFKSPWRFTNVSKVRPIPEGYHSITTAANLP